MSKKNTFTAQELSKNAKNLSLFRLLFSMDKEKRKAFLDEFVAGKLSIKDSVVESIGDVMNKEDLKAFGDIDERVEELRKQYINGDFSIDITEFGKGKPIEDVGSIDVDLPVLVRALDKMAKGDKDDFLVGVYKLLKIVLQVGRIQGIVDAAQFSSVRELGKGQAKDILDLVEILNIVDEWKDEWEERFQEEYKKKVLKKIREQKTTSEKVD